MSPKVFFVLTLTLPIFVGAACYFIPSLEGFGFISMVAFIPYVICALILAALAYRTNSLKALVLISALAPLLMCFILGIFLQLLDPPEIPMTFDRLLQLASDMPIVGLIGYAYVALAWLLFFAAKQLRIVNVAAPPNYTLQRTGET